MSDRLFKIILYLYAFFSDFFLVYAVDKLIFQENGLSVTQIAVIISLWGGMQLLLEIPSGILADKWNRKYMLALTGLSFFICYLIWLISPNFIGYLIGFSFFFAAGESFISGTDQAYIYDYLSDKKQIENYEKVYGRFRSLRLGGIAFGWLLGGFFSDVFSYDFVIIAGVFSGLITFLLALLLPKIPQVTPVENQNPFLFLKDSLNYAFRHPIILNVFLVTFIIGSSSRLIDEYWSIYYHWYGFSNTTLGILVFVAAILGSIVGMFTHKFKKNLLQNINILSGVLTAIFLLTGLFKSIIIIGLLMLFDVLAHLIGIMSDTLIQKHTLEDRRSTIASTNSFLKNVFLISGLFFGWIADKYSIQEGYLFLGILCLSYFGFIAFLPKKV